MSFRIGRLKVEIGFLFTAFTAFLLSDGGKAFVPVFVSALLHELGHVLALLLCSQRDLTLTLRPGGAALRESRPPGPAQELFCSLAGPAVNGVLLLIFGLIGKRGVLASAPLWRAVNLLLLAGNLLPLSFLDGGRALSSLCDLAFLSAEYQNALFPANLAVLSVLCGLTAALRLRSGTSGPLLFFTGYCFLRTLCGA